MPHFGRLAEKVFVDSENLINNLRLPLSLLLIVWSLSSQHPGAGGCPRAVLPYCVHTQHIVIVNR